MERHEPPPSLWPIGFAVGVVCLLVGLIVSWVAVAIGAVILVICGALWARDVATGGGAPAGPGPGAGGGGAPPGAPGAPPPKGGGPGAPPPPGAGLPRGAFP